MTIYEKIEKCTFIDNDEYSLEYGNEYIETKRGTRYYYFISLENSNDPEEWKVYAAERMGGKMMWIYLKSLKENEEV